MTRAETSQELEQVDDEEDAHVDGEEPTAKCVRCQDMMKQKERVVVYARHHGVRLTETKLGIPRKNIQLLYARHHRVRSTETKFGIP